MLFVLSLVLTLKQQFNELINGKSQTNRDQKSNLIFLQRHNTEEFNSSLLKKQYKDIDIYYIGYITIDNCENIYGVNPLYLIIGKVHGHTEEKYKSKYLVFDSTYENKTSIKKVNRTLG